jgi:hypothetical protein
VYEAPERPGLQVAVTYHPAFILRQRDPHRFTEAYCDLVSDLRAAAAALAGNGRASVLTPLSAGPRPSI